MNAFLTNIIVDIAKRLSEFISENPLYIGKALADSDRYLDHINSLFINLENENSIYHVIPEDYAMTILVNTVYQDFPAVERLNISEKSSFMNMISVNIAAYYKDYEQSKELPEGPIESNPTDSSDKKEETDTDADQSNL